VVRYSDFSIVVTALVSGVMGIIIAMILKTMYEEKIIINEMITGTITIESLQLFVIIACLIVGIIIAVSKS